MNLIPALSALLFIVLVPYIIILLPLPAWVARAIANATSFFGVVAIIFWVGLSYITTAASSSKPQDDPPRRVNDERLRIIIILAGLIVFYFNLPFIEDLASLVSRGHPVAISGTVTKLRYRSRGPSTIRQDVEILQDGMTSSERYHLHFCFKSIYTDKRYEFLVLPKSREILDFYVP